MSENTTALVVTVIFFAVMAAWIPLVECCVRAMRRQPEKQRPSQNRRVVEMKPDTRAKKGRGYEAVVLLITMVASVCSLGLPS